MTLLLDGYEPTLVPHVLVVGHNDHWTECKVVLHGRQPHINLPPPSPPPGSPESPAPQINSHVGTSTQLRYMPPWRRRIHALPPDGIGHHPRGVPVAAATQGYVRSTMGLSEPGPGGKLMQDKSAWEVRVYLLWDLRLWASGMVCFLPPNKKQSLAENNKVEGHLSPI